MVPRRPAGFKPPVIVRPVTLAPPPPARPAARLPAFGVRRLLGTFPALRHRNFRLFVGGQLVSLVGTWMQQVAHGWLVLQLSDSAFIVGLVSALGSLPILLLTLYGGVVADEADKRRLVLWLQAGMMLEALVLAVLTVTGQITVPLVMLLAALFGVMAAFEVPARQALVPELVGRADLLNAVAINSMTFNVSRVIGPAIAGVVIATAGIAACFFANAASFLAVIAGLWAMRVPSHDAAAAPRRRVLPAIREGFDYIWAHRWPRWLLIQFALLTVFGFSFVPLLPVLAKDALATGAGGYGALAAAVGVGAAGGALAVAAWSGRMREGPLALRTGIAFGAGLALLALAPSVPVAMLLLALLGALMAIASIATNTTVQRHCPDALRGRVLSVYAWVVLGMAPFGSFQMGWVAERLGVKGAYLLGGVACVLAGAAIAGLMHREARERLAAREEEG